jgi:rare lipoprotein A
MMHWRSLLASFGGLLALLFLGAGCMRTPAPAPETHKEHKEPATQSVNASFYGEQQAGQRTANGEVFDPGALTSAHRSYPFGTMLKVTNPENGKSVRVRINDRGPYGKNRSLDLSRRAAREIGMEQDGVSPVKIEVIKPGTSGD